VGIRSTVPPFRLSCLLVCPGKGNGGFPPEQARQAMGGGEKFPGHRLPCPHSSSRILGGFLSNQKIDF